MQPLKHSQILGWAALPNSPCRGPTHFAAEKNHFVLMLCRLSTTFKWTDGRAPPNTDQLFSRCWKLFFFWVVWSVSKTFELTAGPCSPKHGRVLFTVLKNRFVWMFWRRLKAFNTMTRPRSPTSSVTAQLNSQRWKIISFWCCADFQQRSNERMVVLPQTHSCSFHGVEDFSHLDGMKLFKNIRTYGWALFLQTRPSSFHGVEEPFRLMLCSEINTFKFMAGPGSPTSPVTAQLFLRRWRLISFRCCTEFKQLSNKRIIVLLQTQLSCFHGVENFIFLDGMKRFNNIRTFGWVVLPQTRLSYFRGVEEPFRLDVLPPFKNIPIQDWAALPNIPCHGPAHFPA